MSKNPIQLTSAEIASIWTAYMIGSMARCMLGYFLSIVEDRDIRSIVQQAHDAFQSRTETLRTIFQQESLPVPTGFTNEDVNMNAPRLYSDSFILEFISHLSRAGLIIYSGFTSMSARKDMRTHFIEGLTFTSTLYDMCAELSLSKGTFIRAPHIPYPTEKDYINSDEYVSGFNPFSNKRPLNAQEISYLFMNIKTNIIGGKLSLSFAQTSPKDKVQDWMLKGRDITKKHIQIFAKILADNDIQAPASPDHSITNSTTPPFSDKLMMFLMSLLNQVGVGNYSTAASASLRNDLIVKYEQLSLEVGRFAKEGTDIMFKNNWFEQPPGTTDKDKLAKHKNN